MRHTHFRPPTIAALCVAAAFVAATAQAQTTPPIKPGLWQVQSERELNGQKAPDPMEQMKNLPPEARKQMEAMMKQRGVDMGQGGGLQKVCHTRESLDKGRWKDDSERCKTDITHRSATAWKWRSVCTQPDAEMDGEATFTGPESYTVKTLMTSQRAGKPQTMRMTMTAKWVGADCGDLRPMQAKELRRSRRTSSTIDAHVSELSRVDGLAAKNWLV